MTMQAEAREGGQAALVADEVLMFEVEGQRHAVPATIVAEVLRAVAIAPLPRAPRVVAGIINVRGRLVPVLDLRRRFGAADRPVDPAERLLLLRGPQRLIGLRADQVLGLQMLPEGSLQAVERLVPGADQVAGVARLPDGVLLVYDLESLLNDAEARALDAVVSGRPA
jgi:purine-binding chemotaxis protein CheW